MRLHTQSAQAQQEARESLAKVRAELYRRLEEGQTLEIHGNEVVVCDGDQPRSHRAGDAGERRGEGRGDGPADYDVHRMATARGPPAGGSIEDFIDRLEQEEATERPDVEPLPDW